METINKISDKEIEVSKETTTKLLKANLQMRKTYLEKELAQVNKYLAAF